MAGDKSPTATRTGRIGGRATGVLAAGALLMMTLGGAPARAGSPVILITPAGGTVAGVPVPVGPCPSGVSSDYCFSSDPAMANAGDTITWVNSSGAAHHLSGSGVNTHRTFTVNIDGSDGSAVFPVSDTFSYTDTLHPEVRGSLIVSPRGAGSGANVSAPVAAPGQSLGQVSGAGASRPQVIAAAPGLGIVTGRPSDLGPQGSTALPPITGTPSPDLGALPPITRPSPGTTHQALVGSETASDGRPWALYAVAALLFLLVVVGGGSFVGVRRWQRRRGDRVPA